MRILFIGGTKRGYLTLKALVEAKAEVVGIISLRQDEHETERYEDAIKSLAQQHNIPLYETKWMKDNDNTQIITEKIRPDIAFVIGCRILIPQAIYQSIPLGALAVHDSLLSEYRGFAPLNWSILNGEDHTGVTLFYLDELMDGGDIVMQKRVPINSTDTAPQVYERVCQATVDIVLETYPLFRDGKAPRIKQSYDEGSFPCSRNPGDGYIDWNQSTSTIYNQIRALTCPYPGAFTYYRNRKLVIWKAEYPNIQQRYIGRISGRVVRTSAEDGSVDVLTGDGVLRILEVQVEGKDKTPAAEQITSVRATLGIRMADLMERIARFESKTTDSQESE